MEKIKTWLLRPTTLFGILIGMSFIAASLLFILTGRTVAMNMQLNNITLTLTIIGVFIGIRRFREEQPRKLLSYGKAFMTGFGIVLISSGIYTLYILILYTTQPELLEAYRQTLLYSIGEIYKDTSLMPIVEESAKQFSPALIAFTECIIKIFYGTLFTLLLAAILKRNVPPYNQQEE